MSGFFRPVELPDFAAISARQAQVDAQRQQLQIAQQRADQEREAQQRIATLTPALTSQDPDVRSNAYAAMAGLGLPYAQFALPMLQTERQNREAADYFRNGPSNPLVALAGPPPSGGGGFSEAGLAINTRSESGGDPNARPRFADGTQRSSSLGPNQFIEGTWLQFAQENPTLFQGMSREQILAARTNPQLSAQATQWYARRNAGALQAAGVPVNDATLGLAHQFDGPVAARIATAPPNTPIEQIVGPAAMRANPDLAGRTAGQVVQTFAQRYRGGGGGGAPAAAGGVNPSEIAFLERALEHPNPEVRRRAQARLEVLRFRTQNNPETYRDEVRDIGGRQVRGQVNTRTGQFTPYAGQTERQEGMSPAQAAVTVQSLARAVASGTASEDDVMRYLTAANVYQNRVSENGTLVSQPLPPYAPGADWVVQRYPNMRFNAQAPATQGAPAVPAQAGDAAPATVQLPPPQTQAAPVTPGAAGGTQRLSGGGGTAPMQSGTARQIEEAQFNTAEQLARLDEIGRSFRPEFQQWGTRWSNMWNSLRERGGSQLSAAEQARLREYTQARAASLENLNRTIQAITGAAMGVQEAARITATMPNPGTGLTDGDSPTEFRAKLDRATEAARAALIRYNWAMRRGVNPLESGVPLEDVPRLVDQRANEIEAEIRAATPDIGRDQLRQQTLGRLRQELGIR